MEEFEWGVRVVSGPGAVGALAELEARRLFLVTDPFFYENGKAKEVADRAGASAVEIFHQVAPDPTVDLVAAGTAKLKAFGPDAVVALGGGSAMDCAKAMVYFSGTDAKLVAIPTTSGSGSEMTDFAILTSDGVKHPLIDRRLRPHTAILDSDLLTELPPKLVAETGFDLIAHAVEAIAGKKAGLLSDTLAKEAFRLAFALLSGSFAGRQTGRLQIHQAASMAGAAFSQAGLGLCHAMAHSLGGVFHVPHGRLNAILLPAVMGVNEPYAGEKYAELAQYAGVGAAARTVALRNLKNGLLRLRRELKLPQTLAQAGVDLHQLRQREKEIVAAALADPCCATNPAPVTESIVRQVLGAVTGRG